MKRWAGRVGWILLLMLVLNVASEEGVGNGDAFAAETNPWDRDGDGMLDVWEIWYGFDPSDASDALEDADGDSLPNLGEFLAGTSPILFDTDGDGVSDVVDAFPLDDAEWVDTDHDGESDRVGQRRRRCGGWHRRLSKRRVRMARQRRRWHG